MGEIVRVGESGLSVMDLVLLDQVYGEFTRAGLPNGWEEEEQLHNFHNFLKISDFSGQPLGGSCLDVGCGTGDFYPFWLAHGGSQYLGIDPLRRQIGTAKTRYPQGNYRGFELLSTQFEGTFDFVFASGSLSAYTPSMRDGPVYLHKMLTKMYELTQSGMVFNVWMPADRPLHICRTFQLDDVLAICTDLAGEDHAYMLEQIGGDTQGTFYMWK